MVAAVDLGTVVAEVAVAVVDVEIEALVGSNVI